MAPDPRTGLHKNLDLLSAYKEYERGYPLHLGDISATLAMQSPLYKRIEEGLTNQTQAIAEHQADAAATRRIATEANVPLETLGQMLETLRPQPQPAAAASLATCLLYTSPSPRDKRQSRMPSSA